MPAVIMGRAERIKLIAALEVARDSRVVSVITGDRPGLETRIAQDLIPLLGRHLRTVKKVPRIDLFLYSTGGEVMAGYRMVSLLREYCDHLAVLVPFRCQSTATLICLGADEIVMMPEGKLSPVDPSINGPYNPLIPGAVIRPGTPLPVLPVSVEEVVSYVHLAKEIGGVQGEAGLVSVFEKLTNDVRPLALGQVYRARTQIRMLSRKLLQSHTAPEDEQRIEDIVTMLTEKLYSHDYLISRREAKTFGLNVVVPDVSTETAMVELWDAYFDDLLLSQPFNPLTALQGNTSAALNVQRAFVETTSRLDAYNSERTYSVGPNGEILEQVNFEGWRQQ
jgi:hypothetical protein